MSLYDIEDMIIAIDAIDGVRQVNNCNVFELDKVIGKGGERLEQCLSSLVKKGHVGFLDGMVTVNPSYHKYTVKLKAAHKLCLEV